MNSVEQHQDVDVDISVLWQALKRAKYKIFVFALFSGLAALFLAVNIAPKYQAETRLLIELQESEFTRLSGGEGSSVGVLDEESIESQVEVLRSADLLKAVSAELKLGELEEFNDDQPSMVDQLLITFGLRQPQSAMEIDDRVLRSMREKLSVFRVEKSRVIVMQFQSTDPVIAAKVPDTIADIYLQQQREQKVSSEAIATEWLEPEIMSLRARVKAAEARVAQFRTASDLLSTNNNQSTLADQQLSELSSELSRLRANRASAQATIESVEASLQAGGAIGALPTVLSSSVVQRLNEREDQIRSQLVDLSTTLLDGHPRIISLKAQLRDVQNQIREAANKELVSLRTQVRTAQLREQQMQDELNALKVRAANAGEQEVELRALEREASAERQLLESYLTRFNASTSRQQGAYMPADARIFSRAIVPTEPFAPKILPMVGGAIFGAIMLSVISVLISELFSGRAMRRRTYMPQMAQAPQAAPNYAPNMAPQEEAPYLRPNPTPAYKANRGASLMNARAALATAQVAPRASASGQGGGANGRQYSVNIVANTVVALGNARAVILSANDTADTAGAVMFARYLADENIMTLIIDLTLDAAVTIPMLDDSAADGLTNVLCGDLDLADAILIDKFSSCHVIARGNANPAMALRNIDQLPHMLSTLERAYDLVVVAAGEADPEAILSLIDAKTDIVISALDMESANVNDKIDALAQLGVKKVHVMKPVLPNVQPMAVAS